MDRNRALRWAAAYLAVKAAATLIGVGLLVGGYLLGGRDVYSTLSEETLYASDLVDAAPGLALIVLGLLVWQGLALWGLYWSLTGAVEEALAATYDTERVKSEILSVLDDRLSEMQSTLESSDDTSDFEFE